MRVLLIIPAYNEEESILQTVLDIEKFKQDTVSFSLDYLIINDGSTDSTAQVIIENNLHAVHLIENLGIGGAVQTGYRYAKAYDYDVAIQFDGDGQHDIRSVESLVQPIAENHCDFCVGSRFVPGSISEFQTSSARRTGIKIISFLIKLVTGKKIYDVTSGYRAANKKVISLFAERYPIEYPEPESLVYLFKKKFRVQEKPVNMMERTGGTSSIHSFKSLKYMVDVGTAILISAFMKEHD